MNKCSYDDLNTYVLECQQQNGLKDNLFYGKLKKTVVV